MQRLKKLDVFIINLLYVVFACEIVKRATCYDSCVSWIAVTAVFVRVEVDRLFRYSDRVFRIKAVDNMVLVLLTLIYEIL